MAIELGIELIDKLQLSELIPIKTASILYTSLFVLMGSINLIARITTSFQSDSRLSWIDWILECLSVIVCSLFMTAFFSGCIYLMNSMAHLIFPFSDLYHFHDTLFNQQSVWIALLTKNIFTLDFSGLLNSFLYSIAKMAFFGLLLWRCIRLLVLFCLSQIHILKSLIPCYGRASLMSYISDIISVASWNIYFAAGNRVLSLLESDKALWNNEQQHVLPTIFALYSLYILNIPKYAEKHFSLTHVAINPSSMFTTIYSSIQHLYKKIS
ncbi:hypothetical protein DID78_05795 [Candidatus Marinamargulisbacteria bacterium SCGC AG-343-D04]|nr:hypothetical protein DID78_05795 [Candidatus Marinamargulisbacteria bacterium SCGC AG-343-D04]